MCSILHFVCNLWRQVATKGETKMSATTSMVPKYTVPTLYRRMLKLYIKKFDTDHDTIIRAARQTKFEFWYHRKATPEEKVALLLRGETIMQSIQSGVIPIYSDPKTGKVYCKYDKETIAAAGNHIDPVSAEEFIRRYHDRIPKDELDFVQKKLKECGRWAGSMEFKPEEALKIKTKRRAKCTDPDPEQATPVIKGRTYYWCTCGASQKQPFCDGSHNKLNEEKGTKFKPVTWQAEEDGEKNFCYCKKTKNPPFCDGSHAGLPPNPATVPPPADPAAPAA
jgi:CDGSH-type Zn-finger protein